MEILGINSRWLYLGFVALVALERLLEVRISRRHAARLRARGGFEAGCDHYPRMVALHAGLLAAAPLEVLLLGRPFVPALAAATMALVAATMALRYWVIAALGDRWTTRIFVVPGEAAVRRGPYRLLRHPNYLAVAVEVAALPLIHTAWASAAVFSFANVLLLRTRIRVEDGVLAAVSQEPDR